MLPQRRRAWGGLKRRRMGGKGNVNADGWWGDSSMYDGESMRERHSSAQWGKILHNTLCVMCSSGGMVAKRKKWWLWLIDGWWEIFSYYHHFQPEDCVTALDCFLPRVTWISFWLIFAVLLGSAKLGALELFWVFKLRNCCGTSSGS